MTALVVHLDRVRRAVAMAARLSPHESQRTVAARIVQDIRDETSGDWERVHERAMRKIHEAGGRLLPADLGHPNCRCAVIPIPYPPYLDPEISP